MKQIFETSSAEKVRHGLLTFSLRRARRRAHCAVNGVLCRLLLTRSLPGRVELRIRRCFAPLSNWNHHSLNSATAPNQRNLHTYLVEIAPSFRRNRRLVFVVNARLHNVFIRRWKSEATSSELQSPTIPSTSNECWTNLCRSGACGFGFRNSPSDSVDVPRIEFLSSSDFRAFSLFSGTGGIWSGQENFWTLGWWW